MDLSNYEVTTKIAIFNDEKVDIDEIAEVLKIDKTKIIQVIEKIEGLNKYLINSTTEIIKNMSEPPASVNEKTQILSTYNVISELQNQIEVMKMLMDSLRQRTEDGTEVIMQPKAYIDAWDKLQRAIQWVVETRAKLNQTRIDEIYREEIIHAIGSVDFSLAEKIKTAIAKRKHEIGIDL